MNRFRSSLVVLLQVGDQRQQGFDLGLTAPPIQDPVKLLAREVAGNIWGSVDAAHQVTSELGAHVPLLAPPDVIDPRSCRGGHRLPQRKGVVVQVLA